MTVNQLLTVFTQVTFVTLAIITLVEYLRLRNRTRMEILLMFGDLALIILLQWLDRATFGRYSWLGPLESILLVAQPFLLLRLVRQLQEISPLLDGLSLFGMILSWLLIGLYPQDMPWLFSLIIVAYFAVVEGYSAKVLINGAKTTSGVSQRRLLLAAAGSLFIAAVLLIAGINSVFPSIQTTLQPISQVFGLLSAVSYYLGFAPPGWLRRNWQYSEFHRFFRGIASIHLNETVEDSLERLCQSAERSVGGALAEALIWKEKEDKFSPASIDRSSLFVETGLDKHPKLLEFWRDQEPGLIVFPKSLITRAAHNVRSAYIVPVAPQEKALGVLIVYMKYDPLFPSDDLSLLMLYSQQINIYLAYSNLLIEQENLIAQLQLYLQRLRTLNKIDRGILAARSPHQIARVGLTALRRLVGGQRASVALFDFQNEIVQYIATDSEGDFGPAGGTTIPLSDLFPAVEDLIKNKAILLLNDLGADQPQTPLLAQVAEKGIRSIMLTPLIAEGEVIGAMSLASTEANVYKPEDREIAQEVAYQLAITIQQAKLREELTQYTVDLEKRVAERTAELEIANQELEAFAYSVSHDLRAPLRSIDGFSRVLADRYAENLPDEAIRYLGLVRTNTQQMGELIDDLLAFSRLSRQVLNLQIVEPAPLVKGILNELLAEQADRKFEITISDLAVCRADPSLLKQVFVNLLSNAIKFTGTREVARIEVGSKIDDQETVYYVRDNGVGFEMEYYGKLFGVFQRLHRAEDFEGTGVGLAIVKRVVNRHGGRAWAEAEVDNGATFYISIPNPSPDKAPVIKQDEKGQGELSLSHG